MSEDREDTDPYGVPMCTIVGAIIHPRPPAPIGKSISAYLAKHPPKLDDAIVVDVDIFEGGPSVAWGRIRSVR